MSISASCFENIIGLSRTACPCVDDAPEGANVSESGLYLDELRGLNLQLLNATQSCGSGGLWEKLERAREGAIEETITELMSCIAANTDPKRSIGKSQIGEDQKATATAHKLTRPYQGLTVQTGHVRGGAMYVDSIGASFKPTDGMPSSILVKVYERFESSADPIAVYVVPIEGNRTVWTDITPLALSMEAYGHSAPRYWFVFEPYSGAQAMNDLINCGCGGFAPYWDLGRPQYEDGKSKNGKPWAEWAMAAGTYGSDLATRDQWTTENPTSGLLLRVRFECDERSSFCADAPNYTTDHVQKVLAHAVRYRAGFNLLTDLIHSVDINRWTMTAGDSLEALRQEYLNAWQKRIGEYLCPELSSINNVNRYGDCRKCRDKHMLRRSSLKN